MSRNLKLRQVAEAINISASTYGNLESSPHRVVSANKAAAIADFYRLTPPDRDALMRMWEATPLSEFSERRREKWKIQNERRSLARRVPRLEYALCLLAGMHIGLQDDDKVCVCELDSDPCEVCEALSALGLDAYSTKDHAIAQLAALQGKLEAARAEAQNGAAP